VFPDLASPEFLADPYPTYAQMRATGPLLPMGQGVWLASHHGIADEILRDARFGRDFSANAVRRYGPGIMSEPAFRMVGRFLLLMNPPEHSRLRVLLGKAFGVKQAAELRRLAMGEAQRSLLRLRDNGGADLVADFNYPFPIAVICALLDLGLEDLSLFSRETQALAKVLEITPLGEHEVAAANRAAELFEDYFRRLLAARRRQSGSDLVSLLLKAEEGDDRLSEDEIIANCVLLFLAGHETTANMLGNALWSLFRHPDELARLRLDSSLMSAAVEESLRFEPSVHIAARTALVDLTTGGLNVSAGDLFYINLGSANRDENAYADPDRFILRRSPSEPKPLAFGGGIHFCLGARLARIELECGLEALLTQFPQLAPENPGAHRWKPTLTIRGLESFPVVW
jgi:cytochrome P450